VREIAAGKPIKVYNLSDKIYDYSHYNMVVVEYPLNPYLYQELLACIMDLHEWTKKGNYVLLHDAGLFAWFCLYSLAYSQVIMCCFHWCSAHLCCTPTNIPMPMLRLKSSRSWQLPKSNWHLVNEGIAVDAFSLNRNSYSRYIEYFSPEKIEKFGPYNKSVKYCHKVVFNSIPNFQMISGGCRMFQVTGDSLSHC
jgi:hypothetical protein